MRIRSTAIGAAIALALLVTAACAPPPVPPVGWDQVFLTRDGADVTAIDLEARGVVRVSAPATNTGANSRTLFWPTAAPESLDQLSCATTAHSGLPVQEGVGLRLARSKDGASVRGITVQKNVAFGVDWIYNVHLWDTSRPGREGTVGSSIALLAQFDLHEVMPTPANAELPRRLCARVTGDLVELKVWVPDLPEPDWGDELHTRSVRLPAGWGEPGRPGLYVGHVPAGGFATFADLVQGAG